MEDDSQTPWLRSELIEYIPNARVLLYDHGGPHEQDDLDSLGQNLLTQVHKERHLTVGLHSLIDHLSNWHQSPKRPILFICHSTGGLVATTALVLASQSSSNLGSILSSCHGVAFLATPHMGSSYLSTSEYASSIRHLSRLDHHIPARLRSLLKPRHPRLRQLSNQFKPISADMKIWTFLETADSSISVMDSLLGNPVEIHVPITSIRSGLLDLEHEKEIPLVSDHRGAAYFKGQESTTRLSFIKELQSAVNMAVELSAAPEIPLDVENEVVVQINGFFEDTALGVSDDTPLKLWSTKVSLLEYLKKGPATCLRERIRSSDPLQPGSGDDSSLSELDTHPPPIHTSPVPDDSHGTPSGNATDSQSDSTRSKSSIKKSKSFLAHMSPRIHITEPSDYFDSETCESGKRKSSDEGSLDKSDGNSESESSKDAKGASRILKKLK